MRHVSITFRLSHELAVLIERRAHQLSHRPWTDLLVELVCRELGQDYPTPREKVIPSFGVTQRTIVSLLSEQGPMTAAEITAATGSADSSVHSALEPLTIRGILWRDSALVARCREGYRPRDTLPEKCYLYSLSDTGRVALRQVRDDERDRAACEFAENQLRKDIEGGDL